ncbi:MAG: hypothetical protein ACI4DY_03780 [Monoglobaceae bacterium]
MKKKWIMLFILAVVFTEITSVFADEVQSISCTYNVSDTNVSVTGRIINAQGTNQVTLLVGNNTGDEEWNANEIIYVDQTASDEDGNFTFDFRFPDNLPSGNYMYRVGSNSSAQVYTGTIAYEGRKENVMFVDANLNISINAYVPSISGTVVCPSDISMVFSVFNSTDNTVIANETVTYEDGEVNLAYTLPSLLSPKNYTAEISFINETGEIGNISISIDSSILTVNVTGSVMVSNDVTLDVRMKSVNTSLVDKSTTITEDRSVSVTIPNIIGSTLYNVSLKGYEYRNVFSATAPSAAAEYIVSGNANDEVKIAASASNIASFSDREFILEYNSNQIIPISLFGLYKENTVGTGQMGYVNITECSDGRIVFTIDRTIAQGEEWSGILNVFKFKYKDDYSGQSTITLSEE